MCQFSRGSGDKSRWLCEIWTVWPRLMPFSNRIWKVDRKRKVNLIDTNVCIHSESRKNQWITLHFRTFGGGEKGGYYRLPTLSLGLFFEDKYVSDIDIIYETIVIPNLGFRRFANRLEWIYGSRCWTVKIAGRSGGNAADDTDDCNHERSDRKTNPFMAS